MKAGGADGDSGRYIITGGAIKLTATMQEREHTLEELHKLNKVRDYLLSQGIFDYNGFEDYDEGKPNGDGRTAVGFAIPVS